MPIIASDDTTLVFPFRLYDIAQDDYVSSRRLATIDAIRKLGAVQAGPSFSIPSSDVDENGFTVKGYNGYDAERKPR